MPAVLTDTRLADPHVPAAWSGVLADLDRFVRLEAAIRAAGDDPPAAAQVSEMAALHERLLVSSRALLEPAALAGVSTRELALLFARAVLLTVRLKQCVIGSAPVLDTAGSRTLAHYEADFYGNAAAVDALRQRLRRQLALSADDLDEIEAVIRRDLADAARKKAVVQALRDEFGLHAPADDLPRRVQELFTALYPGAPLRVGEVSAIVTGTLVFFCLPLEEGRWQEPPDTDRTPQERQAVTAFVAQLLKFTQARFGNFPAFGAVDRERVAAELWDRLAARSGQSVDAVAEELPRLVTVIPAAEVDKYVIHDAWGHGWQASMLRFEQMYAEMARYARRLELDEAAPTSDEGRITLEDCFTGLPDDARLDERRFRRFVAAEIAQRLPVAMSAVLAEQLADVAEFKFLAQHPLRAGDLPTSSLLAWFPSKLDLTLRDVPFYFSQATKVFRLWAGDPARQARTVEQLVGRGAAPAAAGRAVARAVEIWEELAAADYAQALAWTPTADGRLRTNVFTRLALNFLGIHRSLVELYDQVRVVRPARLPLKSYRDLLLVAASVFFEADRPGHLWRVDEFLALEFLPLCRRLDG